MPTPLQTRPLDLPEHEFVNWLQRQGKSIGGSSIGAICGLSTYSSPISVWDGLVSPNVMREDNNSMARGRIMEPHIADMYVAATGRHLVQLPSIRHPEKWWFRATPDRGITHRTGGTSADSEMHPGILECKSLGRETFALSRNEGVDPAYYAQIQWYMGLFNYGWGAFALHNLDAWTLHHFDVEFDRPYFDWMMQTAQTFWDTFVLTRTRPSDDLIVQSVGRPETPRAGATSLTIDTEEWRRKMNALRDAQENFNLAEAAKEYAQQQVKDLMGAQELVSIPGIGRVSYAESHRTSFNKEELYRDYPELIGRYERRTTTRVFRPTFENGQTTAFRRR
jgi:putative phage-type endonuclease